MKKIILFLLLHSGISAIAQERFGYIQYDKAIQSLPAYPLSQNKLELLRTQLEDSARILIEPWEKIYSRCIYHDPPMDAAKIKNMEDSINALNVRVEKYREYAVAKYMGQQTLVEAELNNLLIEGMKSFCIDKNILCISDKELIFSCKDCADLTEELVAYLKEKR